MQKNELVKWQVISLVSRLTAMAIGIIQSFVIVRILTVGEFGLVQLAVAIGSVVGIYQHLGLASGSTREIAAAKDDTDIFKIFVTSVVIRYLITIPLAIGLFLLSENIAVERYNEPSIILPLKLFAVNIIISAVQSLLNSVIAGTKNFRSLFVYQAVIAVVSLFIYIPLVYKFRVDGYFYALLIFHTISSLSLTLIAFRPLRGRLVFPGKADFVRILKAVFSISMAIYAVKVIYTLWEKSGPLLLGVSVTAEALGIFSFAALYAKKLVSVSDAVTDVNLPVFSEKFTSNLDEFKLLFTENFNKVFAFIVFSGMSAVFWAPELITVLVGSDKYNSSFPLILPLVFSFIFYSFINVIKSSISVPGRLVKEMIAGYFFLLAGTVGFYVLTTENYYITNTAEALDRIFIGFGSSAFFVTFAGNLPKTNFLNSMALGMVLGGLISFAYLTVTAQKRLKFKFITHDHTLILIQALVVAMLSGVGSFIVKVPAYFVFSSLFVLSIWIAKFIDKDDIDMAISKITYLSGKFKRG
jgi:O-antigen/teichoic acid export membrane protein